MSVCEMPDDNFAALGDQFCATHGTECSYSRLSGDRFIRFSVTGIKHNYHRTNRWLLKVLGVGELL